MADRVQRAPSKQLFGPFNVKYLLDVVPALQTIVVMDGELLRLRKLHQLISNLIPKLN